MQGVWEALKGQAEVLAEVAHAVNATAEARARAQIDQVAALAAAHAAPLDQAAALDDFSVQVDELARRFDAVKAEVDKHTALLGDLAGSATAASAGVSAHLSEIHALQRDMRDAHDAIVTHETDITECMGRATQASEAATKTQERLEVEFVEMRKEMDRELTSLKQKVQDECGARTE